MTFKQSVVDELRRSPVATISGAASAALAAIGLGLAWLQYSATLVQPAAGSSLSSIAQPASQGIALGNLFLVVAYFIAVITAVAVVLRLTARKHDVATFFASVPTVALANFSAVLVVYLAPPRAISPQLFQQAHDLVFYGSASIIIVFCGTPMLRNLFESTSGEKSEPISKGQSSESGGPTLLLALILLFAWGSLVFAGQSRLTKTLLPEITHPVDKSALKSAA